MAADERHAVNDWNYPPPYNQRIIEMKLQKRLSIKNGIHSFTDVGEITLNNGVSYLCYSYRLLQLQVFEFGTVLKLTSLSATENWFQEHEFWQSLQNVVVLHIHGDWTPQSLTFVIRHCKSLKSLSFTYWKCETALPSLNALKHLSGSLDELTIDLNGTNDTISYVVEYLAHSLTKFGRSLKRLMILTPESLPGDPIPEVNRMLNSVLAQHACIYLLYGQEETFCVKRLQHYDFKNAAWFFIATNDFMYQPETSNKVFDFYEIYQKKNCNFNVGCRIGYHGNRLDQFKHMDEFVEDYCSENTFYTYSSEYRYPHPAADNIPSKVLKNMEFAEYKAPIENHGRRVCCNPVKYKSSHPIHRYGTPGFEATKVQEFVYFEENLEIYLSNGLITRLPKRLDENEFCKYWLAAKRFVVRSTSFNRRHVNVKGLREFLRAVEHIEFTGFWFTDLFKYFIPRFSDCLRVWSMTRVCLERNVLREILNHLEDCFYDTIEEFHYDGRDTNGDDSIASILNALSKDNTAFRNIRDLYLVANTWSSSRYFCDLNNAIQRIKGMTQDQCQIVVAVLERTPICYKEFEKNNKLAIFPDMYSARFDTTYFLDYCNLVEYYCCRDGGHSWSLIQSLSNEI